MPRLTIGLDFGTTFSGVSWALEFSNEVEVISTWPKSGNRTPGKVPTTLAYQENKILWGYQTASLPPDSVFQGFKLLLDESQHDQYRPAVHSKTLLEKHGKTAVDVAGDYLKCLVSHANDVLQRRLGAAFQCMELHYVLTVPAVWSDKAKDATRMAGVKAGIPVSDITMISEPDAAATYCLDTLQPEAIKEDDVAVVCDAGGGTVDLISYRISNLEPLVLKEETQGTGGICGSACLDSRFNKLLKDLLGENYAEVPSLSLDTALSHWTNDIKPSFGSRLYDDCESDGDTDTTIEGDGSDDDDVDSGTIVPYIVPLPGVQDNPDIFLKNSFLYLDWEQVRDIFDPVVSDVEQLVRGQVESIAKNGKIAKAILLVGGFGSSEYLFRRLKKAFPGIMIMQPPNAWTAVLRGAVSHGIGLNPVSERIARCHYGIHCNARYDPDRHDKSTRYWDTLDEIWRVTNAMEWYIRKGSVISENRPVSLPFCSKCTLGAEEIQTRISLYVNHGDEAPVYLSDDTFKVCTIDVDLSSIPRYLFRRKVNSQGTVFYELDYHIRMTPKSATLLFELVFSGATYGCLEAKY